MGARQEYDGTDERRVLTAMIVSTEVLARLSPCWVKEGRFASDTGNTLGNLCVEYFRKWKKAPDKDIITEFVEWSRGKDKNTVSAVTGFLQSLSDSHYHATEVMGECTNPAYDIMVAGKLFNRVRCQKLEEALTSSRNNQRTEKNDEIIAKYSKPIELGVGAGLDVLIDKEVMQLPFAQKSRANVLIEYPGAIGQFFGDSLERGGFISFFGSSGSGKSFILADMAYRAALQRRRVALFQVGDMNEEQVLRRLYSRVTHHPWRSANRDGKWPCVVPWPKEISTWTNKDEHNRIETSVTHKEKQFDKPLDYKLTWTACEEVMKREIKSKRSWFKLSCHPNYSINVDGIKSVLDGWASMEWVPDVIVIDYCDLLTPPAGFSRMDRREQINASWIQLSGLRQERQCMVVTATQSDAKSYDKWLLTRDNFTDDRRKLDHVSGMIGINVQEHERANGTRRLNWVKCRDQDYNADECVHIAGCYAVADPIIKSTLEARESEIS